MEKRPNNTGERFKDPIFSEKFIVGGLFDFEERFKKVSSDPKVLVFLLERLTPILGEEFDSRVVAETVSDIVKNASYDLFDGERGGFSKESQDQMASLIIEALVVDPEKMRKTKELERYFRTGNT